MAFKPLSCVFGKLVIPQRYTLMIMIHLALINVYHIRVVLNIAITEMIKPQNETVDAKYDSCPNFHHEIVDIKGGSYEWNTALRAQILYAFFIGYVISHVPGGWLADKLGGRHVLGTCLLVSAIETIVFPIAVQQGGHIPAILLRFILGVFMGPMYPAASSFLQKWAPASERTFMAGIAYSGGNLGAFYGNLFTGLIIKKTNSWPMAFYIWGLLALLWYVFFLFMVYSSPATHPFITPEEKEKLQAELVEKGKFKVPWLKLVTSVPIYAILLAQLAHDYTLYTLVTDLPKFMKDILKLNVQQNAAYSSLPFLGMGISNICVARLSDFIIKRGWLRVIVLRKINAFIGNVGPAVCVVIASHIGCTRMGAVAMYTIGMIFKGFIYSGSMVNINDVSRNFAGTIMACINGIGASTGVLAAYVVGLLTPNGTIEEWRLVFWIVFIICVVSTAIFIVFGSSEQQPWDKMAEEVKDAKTQE